MFHVFADVLTQLCGGLHQAPGLTAPLSNDQVQDVGLQTVLQHLVQGRAQVLQDQVTHVGTHPAVAQLSLAGKQMMKKMTHQGIGRQDVG